MKGLGKIPMIQGLQVQNSQGNFTLSLKMNTYYEWCNIPLKEGID